MGALPIRDGAQCALPFVDTERWEIFGYYFYFCAPDTHLLPGALIYLLGAELISVFMGKRREDGGL